MGQIIAKVREIIAEVEENSHVKVREIIAEVEENSHVDANTYTPKKVEKRGKDDKLLKPILKQINKENENENKVIDATDAIALPAARPLEKKRDRWIKHYCSSHQILLVGEGDFSFSSCLAKAFATAENMVATSLDSIYFLERNYASAMSNINYLKMKGCTVIHNVDATEMANHHWLSGRKFDRIIYNFPLAGFFQDESRDNQLEFNQNLVRLFMMNAKDMINEKGEIHITHKSNGFFREWDLERLGLIHGLWLIEDAMFSLTDYPGYNTKYGFGGDGNFYCEPSKTYKFGLV